MSYPAWQKDESYSEFQRQSNLHIVRGGARYFPKPNYTLPPFEEWARVQAGGNKFFVKQHIASGTYTDFYLLKEKTGYTESEFTAAAVNNDPSSPLKLIDALHHRHKKRASGIMFADILTSNIDVVVLEDYYTMYFKIRLKNGEWVSVRRETYAWEVSENYELISRVDIWTLLDEEVKYFRHNISMSNTALADELNTKSYLKNLQMIGLGDMPLSRLKWLHYKLERSKVNFDNIQLNKNTVQKRFGDFSSDLRLALENFYESLQGIEEIRDAAQAFGVIPVPGILLKPNTKKNNKNKGRRHP